LRQPQLTPPSVNRAAKLTSRTPGANFAGEHQVSVYDLSSVSRVGVLSGHAGPVTTVACGEDWVMSGSSDSTLRLWQVRGVEAPVGVAC